MQVVPVLFDEYSEIIKYSDQWDLSYSADTYSRFQTYISECKRLGSWGSNETLDEYFLAIF